MYRFITEFSSNFVNARHERQVPPATALLLGITSALLLLAGCAAEEPLASAPAPSVAPVPSRNLCGFIDKTGKFLIKPQFITASSFHEGLAHVVDPRGSFIDKTGAFIIKEPYYVAGDFSEGLASVGVPRKSWADVNKPGDQLLYGFIDKTGKMVIKPQFKAALDFSEGMAAVMPDNGQAWGFIDHTGKIVIQPRFSLLVDDLDRDLPSFRHGMAFVTSQSGPACIDKTGKELSKAVCKKAQDEELLDEQGYKHRTEEGQQGYQDKNGKIVIACKFDKVLPFYDGVGLIRISGDKWGFVDPTGKYAIKPSELYDYEHFSEELCQVRTHKQLGSKIGFVDKTGKLVIPQQFSTAEYFHDGLAAVGVPVSSEEIDKIKLPFKYSVVGANLTFPMKLGESDESSTGVSADR